MQLKPRPRNLQTAPTYFKLNPQIIIAAIHDDVEDAVIHSVSRREKITLSFKFSLDNPEIYTKRTSYAGKVMDLRTTYIAKPAIERDAVSLTVRRNVTRTLNLVAQLLSEDESLFKPKVLAELMVTFSVGKATEIKITKSKSYADRHG